MIVFDERRGFGSDGYTLYWRREYHALVIEKGNIQVSITNTELAAKRHLLEQCTLCFIDKKNSLDIQIEELQRKRARMVMDGAGLGRYS